MQPSSGTPASAAPRTSRTMSRDEMWLQHGLVASRGAAWLSIRLLAARVVVAFGPSLPADRAVLQAAEQSNKRRR